MVWGECEYLFWLQLFFFEEVDGVFDECVCFFGFWCVDDYVG